jgi:type I protein arginine methyltransferase
MQPSYVVSPSVCIRIHGSGDLFVFGPTAKPLQKIDIADLTILTRFASPRRIEAALVGLGDMPSEKGDLRSRVEKLISNGILRPDTDKTVAKSEIAPSRFAGAGTHHWMLRDYVRVSAYRSAIFTHAPGKRVLEIGCGCGILSIFAAQAGATSVTAIEETSIAGLAEEMFQTNNVDVQLHVGNSLEVQLSEPADLIIHELFGFDPFFENVLKYIADAKKRFLAPGGRFLPYRLDVCCVGVEAHSVPPMLERALLEAREFETLYQADFSPYLRRLSGPKETDEMANLLWRGGDFYETPFTQPILTRECVLRSVDFTEDFERELSAPATSELEVTCDGRLGSILVYFRAYFERNHVLATSPFTPRTHWGWALTDLARVASVRTGEKVSLRSEVVDTGGWQRLRVGLVSN